MSSPERPTRLERLVDGRWTEVDLSGIPTFPAHKPNTLPTFNVTDQVHPRMFSEGDGIVAHERGATEGPLYIGRFEGMDAEGNVLITERSERSAVFPGPTAVLTLAQFVFYRLYRVSEKLPLPKQRGPELELESELDELSEAET